MQIQHMKTKKLGRTGLADYESISAPELKQAMRENDDLADVAQTVNDLTPTIKLLYFIHEWRLDQAEKEK